MSTLVAPPVRPDYGGANVRGIVPALLGPNGWSTGLPVWMPTELGAARQIVLLVLDGLGWDQLAERRALAPVLAGLTGSAITTVAPSTTATALTSITTGLTPGEHGLVGYRMAVAGEVLNVLRWTAAGDDRRRTLPPGDVQRFPAFMGVSVPVVNPHELTETSFTAAHLRGSQQVGWRATSSLPVEVARLVTAGERFVYAYYAGIDRIAHERGFGEFYDAELVAADRLVDDLLARLPPGCALVVTADHGQVDVGDRVIQPSPGLLALVASQSGEGRFRWLHARRGAAAELLDAARAEFGSVAWVWTRDEVVHDSLLGPTVPPAVCQRLGDVALVAHDDVAFFDPDDTGPYDLKCRHGSLTSAEMRVPLLVGVA